MLAGLIGGFIGILLVADPSLGWGVHGLDPSIALLPSAIGSFWGGYYLWNFYGEDSTWPAAAVPHSRSKPHRDVGPGDVDLHRWNRATAGATLALSAIVIGVGHWTHGTDAASVFVAFGSVGLPAARWPT